MGDEIGKGHFVDRQGDCVEPIEDGDTGILAASTVLVKKIPEGFATITQRFNVGTMVAERVSPEGTAESSLPQVSLLVGNAVLFEQSQELVLERHLPMVLFLGLDVLNGFVQLRQAHAERPYFACQPKSRCSGKVSCTHSEEPPLMSCRALARERVEGNESRT
jgi:hypothetical protein